MAHSAPIDRIEIGTRVRKASSAEVEGLARSIELEGLIHPVMLRQLRDGRIRLVAGLHRVEAFKQLKKPEIPCVWMPLTGDDRIDDCTEEVLECAENLDRAGLPEAVRMLFTNKLASAIARRSSVRSIGKAKVRMAEAKAATAAAVDRHAKAKAREEYKNAHKSLERAEEVEVKVSASTSSGGELRTDRLPKGVLDEVSAEMGVAKMTISNDLASVRYFGQDILTLASDIQLHFDGAGPKPVYTTRGELAALRTLKEEHKAAYEEVIASWRKAAETKGSGSQRPSLVLAKIAMRAADLKKQESRSTVIGALDRLQQEISAANKALADAYSTAATLSKLVTLKSIPTDIRAMRDKLDGNRRFLTSLKEAHKEVSAD